MGINSLVRSKKYKNFMAKLYGWGASVVMLGALFKINHYPGANIMLIVGLGTEAIIFFFSAFEPPYVEPDWSLVYPELAGMYTDVDVLKPEQGKRKTVTEELDNMLEEAKIGPELIESLGAGLRNLSDNTAKLSDITAASVITGEYVESMKGATSSADELAETYKKASENIEANVSASTTEFAENVKTASKSATSLSSAYEEASELLKQDLGATGAYISSVQEAADSLKNLTKIYNESAGHLTKAAESIDFSSIDGQQYNEQLQKISKNLEALNSVYELQLQSSNANIEAINKMQETIGTFLGNLDESVENTVKYKDQVAVLAKNVAALNSVYGNMLAAMNVNVNQ